jgi:hypothetical protein
MTMVIPTECIAWYFCKKLKINIVADNTRTITNLHDLLDYDARKFISAEVQLKNILPEWTKQSRFFTTKNRITEIP